MGMARRPVKLEFCYRVYLFFKLTLNLCSQNTLYLCNFSLSKSVFEITGDSCSAMTNFDLPSCLQLKKTLWLGICGILARKFLKHDLTCSTTSHLFKNKKNIHCSYRLKGKAE